MIESYSVTQVETLTGINAHTLRIWERRYNFLKAHRTESNIRFYSGEQLKQLLNIAVLTRNGYRISKIDSMSREEINNIVTQLQLSDLNQPNDDVNMLTIAMLEYNEENFNKIFHKSILRKGILTTVTELIYPFLNQVGVLWGTNKVSPPQEHFASNLIRQKIIAAIDALPLPLKNAPTIILFLLENEDHELGLLLSSFIAKDLGWKVIYLGQRMPTVNLKEAVLETNASFLFTILTTPRTERFVDTLEFISEETNTTIIYSVNPAFIDENKILANSKYVASPNELIDFLNSKTL